MPNAVTDATFEKDVLQSDTPVMVDFWAPWCGPCRAISPIVDQLEKEYTNKLVVLKMNVDENRTIPGKYGIRAIPALVIFKDGEVVEQIMGAVSKSNIVSVLEQKVLA